MKLKFKQIKRQKEGLFGGSKPGYSYQLVFMLSLEAEELQVIKDHQMHDYVLFEGKIAELQPILFWGILIKVRVNGWLRRE